LRTRKELLSSFTPDRDYWLNFLKNEGLISDIETEIEEFSPAPSPPSPVELTPDQQIWVARVAEKLVYAPQGREQIRRELSECLMGKRSFNDWFNQTAAERGLTNYDLLKILHDSLEGLTSREASALKKQYEEALRKLGGL
jgi:hypothetical protein